MDLPTNCKGNETTLGGFWFKLFCVLFTTCLHMSSTILGATTEFSLSTIDPCPLGWDFYEPGNTCFFHYRKPESWSDAKAKCGTFDTGNLAVITDEGTHNFIKDHYDDDVLWIGAQKPYNSGSWKWITTWDRVSDQQYQGILSQPLSSLTSGNCGYLKQSMLHSISCGDPFNSLCQKEAKTVYRLIGSSFGSQKLSCPPGWEMVSGRCFQVVTGQQLSWEASREECKALGGDLAVLSIEEVFDTVRSTLGTDQVWIGMTISPNQLECQWVNGERLTQIPPYMGYIEHHLSGECIAIDYTTTFVHDCLLPKSFICEKGPSTVVVAHYCQDGWTRYRTTDKCFKTIEDTMKWQQARDRCQNEGGDLARITDENMYQFIRNDLLYWDAYFWIGLKRANEHSYFYWIKDNKPYGHWQTMSKYGQGFTEACVTVSTKAWYFHSCYLNAKPLCQIETIQPVVVGTLLGGNQELISKAKLTCPSGWKLFEKGWTCVGFFEDNHQDYQDAARKCEDHGGHLAKLADEDIVNFVADHRQNMAYWFGLDRRAYWNTFRWQDGTALTGFDRWDTNEPSSGSDRCVLLRATDSIKWKVEDCGDDFAYICQIDYVQGSDSLLEYTINGRPIYISKEKATYSSVAGKCESFKKTELFLKSDDEFLQLGSWLEMNRHVFGEDIWMKTSKPSYSDFRWANPSNVVTEAGIWKGDSIDYSCYNKYTINKCCTYINDVSRLEAKECDSEAFYICVDGSRVITEEVTSMTTTKPTTNNPNLVHTCPNGWLLYEPDETCFKFFNYQKNWDNARNWCQSVDADLAILPDQDTHNFIRPHIPTDEYVWFGMYTEMDETGTQTTYWVNGDPILDSQTKWDNGQPDLIGSECGNIKEMAWRDWYCGTANPFICQKGSMVIMEEVTSLAIPNPTPNGPNLVFTCPNDWLLYEPDETCFKFVNSQKNWENARASCQNMDADLAILPDQDTRNFLMPHIPTNKYVWFGMYTKVNNTGARTIYWVNGDPVSNSQTNWRYDQPDGTTSECGSIKGMGWGDWRCDHDENLFICQKGSTVITEEVTSMTTTNPTTNDPNLVHTCPNSWLLYEPDETCFKVVKYQNMNWQDARDLCQNVDADLAILPDQDTHKFLEPHIPKDDFTWFGMYTTVNGTEIETNWVNGDPILSTETSWAATQPDGTESECGCIDGMTSAWHDASCSRSSPFICQKDAVFYPTTQASVNTSFPDVVLPPTASDPMKPQNPASINLPTQTSANPLSQASVNPSTQASVNPSTHTSVNPPTHTSITPPIQTSLNPPTETSANPSTHTSINPPTQTSLNLPTQTSVNPLIQTSVNPPTQTYLTPSIQTSINPPTQTSINPPTQTSINQPIQTSINPPTQTSINPPTQTSVNPSIQTSINPPTQTSENLPTQTSINPPTQISAIQPTQTSINPPTQTSANQPTQTSINPPTQTSINPPPRTSAIQPTQTSINPPTQTSVNPPTQTSINPPTQTSVNPPTQTSMNTPIQASVNPPTQTSSLPSTQPLPPLPPSQPLTLTEKQNFKESLNILKTALSSNSGTRSSNSTNQAITIINKLCPCACSEFKFSGFPSPSVLANMVDKIQKSLRVDTTSLASAKNKKTSAKDDRSSSQSIAALAIVLGSIPFFLIVGVDLIRVYQFFTKRRMRKQRRK